MQNCLGNQPDILARKKDACEDTTAFEPDIDYKIIDDNCWNDDIKNIKDKPDSESKKKRRRKDEVI